MNLHEIEKRCRFYRRTKMVEREKQLLKAVLLNPDKNPDWTWGIQRMTELDPGFVPLNDEFNFEIEPDVTPTSREEIAKFSFQYQDEWRFEREKRLIQYALKLYPDWKYLHDRMEWHSRPIFHRDPEKSKTQPRKPLHLPRDPKYIPKQETIDSMCFVTGTSSNAPYFDLCVQLIESIKATRWYNHVPIKVLDCGLTKEDAHYLRERFGCEVKDPGWMVPVEYINPEHYPLNGLKSMAAKFYINNIFPNYEYYCWLDCDTWIQHEFIIDEFLTISEKQGFCILNMADLASSESYKIFCQNIGVTNIFNELSQKKARISNGSLFVGNKIFFQHYQKQLKNLLEIKINFFYGTDDILLINTAYQENNNIIFPYNSNNFYKEIIEVNKRKALILKDKEIGLISLTAKLKFSPYHCVFKKHTYYETIYYTIFQKNDDVYIFEDMLHHLNKNKDYSNGTYFYRIYQNSDKILEVLK